MWNTNYFGNPYQQQQIVMVNNIESARMYNLRANSSAILLDSNQPIAYIVRTDGAGLGCFERANGRFKHHQPQAVRRRPAKIAGGIKTLHEIYTKKRICGIIWCRLVMT